MIMSYYAFNEWNFNGGYTPPPIRICPDTPYPLGFFAGRGRRERRSGVGASARGGLGESALPGQALIRNSGRSARCGRSGARAGLGVRGKTRQGDGASQHRPLVSRDRNGDAMLLVQKLRHGWQPPLDSTGFELPPPFRRVAGGGCLSPPRKFGGVGPFGIPKVRRPDL